MKDIEVIRVLKSMSQTPEKYLRININKNGAYIHLPDDVHLSITNAILSEFAGNERKFFYSFDASQVSDLDPNFRCIVGMKKNKELAYIEGNPEDNLLSGYIRCKPKNEEEVDAFDDCDNNGDSIFFGIVTTKLFTIIFAADTHHSKTFQCEYMRGDENQPGLEDIILTLSQSNQSVNCEVYYEQEEQKTE